MRNQKPFERFAGPVWVQSPLPGLEAHAGQLVVIGTQLGPVVIDTSAKKTYNHFRGPKEGVRAQRP